MPESHPTDSAEPDSDSPGRTNRTDTFAVMLAHDLRNPLTVARGRLSLANEELESEHLDAAIRAHERIDQIVEDYMRLARGDSLALDEGPVDLASIVDESWQYVPTVSATLCVETERDVRADRNRLRQLLENLIRNAVEHGGDDVTVAVGDLEDGFYFEDDGTGIPADVRSAVVDDTRSSVADEGGFGLTIVSRIVEAHGWELDVTNGDGARFEVTGITFVE